MAMSIQTNSTALGAMGKLNTANSALSKTIGQLSSGFRINSASDDASGLAVSEKLRGQISGLKVAASNSQDAISMLQTAEGAMGSMTSVIQRMRELAVQAGDPAYTTNDRAVLQLEVDQLKQEVNRISSSTEFNTKKLLNGDASALWSSTSADLEAIVRGAPAEGNYKVQVQSVDGSNNVYKTDVMSLKEGALAVREFTDGNARGAGIKGFENLNGMMSTDSAGGSSKGPDSIGIDIRVGTAGLTGIGANSLTSDSAGTTLGSFIQNGGDLASALTSGATLASTKSGIIEIELLGDKTTSSSSSVRVRFMDGETGALSDWKELAINADGVVSTAADTTIVTGVSIRASAVITTEGKAGDRVLIGTSGTAGSAAGSVSIGVGTGVGQAGYAIAQSAVKSTDGSNLVNSSYDNRLTYYTGQINTASGTVAYGSMDIVMAKAAAPSLSVGSVELNIDGKGAAASKYTQLKDIARFVNSDGRNVLDNTQTLTIFGNNKEAKITLEGYDTIADMESKLTKAIVEQLGMGSPEGVINENLVNFVTPSTRADNTNEAVNGTFVIQSALLGKNSAISFAGDQGLIDALSLSQIKTAEESKVTVTVTNAHTGAEVGSDVVTDGILRGVIQGIDVKVNPTTYDAYTQSWDATTKRITFTPKASGSEEYLHIANNATKAAIGANEGQTIDLSIGEMSTRGLEIDDVSVVNFELAQKSITKIDQALEKLSTGRAKIGAQINRLDYTINNLNNARENLTASESRIRDLDIAEASSQLASRQVLIQSATAMLAQANQIPSYAAQLLR